MINNIYLEIQYDGTSFVGWQKQENMRSVQEEIENALEKIIDRKTRLVVAGRTDSGVHADGQVANFLTSSKIRPESFSFHLNAILPDDIYITKSKAVPSDFNARFDAKSKTYRYIIKRSDGMHPKYRNFVAEVKYNLDMEMFRDACKKFIGEHDFKAFTKFENGVNTIRKIDKIEVVEKGDFIEVEISAMSFIRNQIRIMIGTMIEVARGRMTLKDLEESLKSGERKMTGPTMPACGLSLIKVVY